MGAHRASFCIKVRSLTTPPMPVGSFKAMPSETRPIAPCLRDVQLLRHAYRDQQDSGHQHCLEPCSRANHVLRGADLRRPPSSSQASTGDPSTVRSCKTNRAAWSGNACDTGRWSRLGGLHNPADAPHCISKAAYPSFSFQA